MVIEGSRLELELPSWCMQTADNSVHCRGCSNAVSHKELVRPREVVVVDGWVDGLTPSGHPLEENAPMLLLLSVYRIFAHMTLD